MTRGAGTSQPVGRPARRRVSATHLLIGVVVILAFLLNFLALQDRKQTTMVAVANNALSAGSTLSMSDLRFIPIDADFEAIGSLIDEGGVSVYEGWVLQRPIADGELIRPGILGEPGAPSGLRTMSLPASVEHAAGGALSSGDRIDIISVLDGTAFYVATDVEVLGISESEGASFGGSANFHILIAVESDQALALAGAIDSGSLEVVRSTGASRIGDRAGSDDG